MSRLRSAVPLSLLIATTASCANSTKQAAAKQVSSLPASPHTGAFVVKLGADTIVVERFARTSNTYSVEQALRSPTARLFHTHLELTPAGDLSNMSYMQHQIGGAMSAPLVAVTDVKVLGDSATIVGKRGDSTTVNRKVAVAAGALQ